MGSYNESALLLVGDLLRDGKISLMNSVHEVVVRDAKVSDADAIIGLLKLLHDERPAEADRNDIELLGLILDQPLRRLLVAESGGSVVGTTDVLVVLNLSRQAKPWAIIENVVVDPASRRRGVARLLMNEAIDYARQKGCYKIQLLSSNTRNEAHLLYESLGFESGRKAGFCIYL